jgi:hypothetical protein
MERIKNLYYVGLAFVSVLLVGTAYSAYDKMKELKRGKV